MLVLCSNGLSSEKILAYMKSKVDGCKTAAFVFSPTLELVNCYSPEMNFLSLTDLRGLSLTQVQVLPHYSKFLSKFDKFEETCCAYEKEKSVQVIRLNDGDGVFIDMDPINEGHILLVPKEHYKEELK